MHFIKKPWLYSFIKANFLSLDLNTLVNTVKQLSSFESDMFTTNMSSNSCIHHKY